MRLFHSKTIFACAFLFAFAFQGCRGESDDTAPVLLTGTAAVGAPIAGGVVTVKDRNGATRSGTADAGGKYRIDVTGLTAPFILKVDPPAGSSLFSVGIRAGVVNIHPFTDLIIGTWYRLRGTTVSDAFSTLGSATPIPTEPEIATLATLVKQVVLRWLTDQTPDLQGFDFMTSPFDANGTGFDALLALSRIDGNESVTIEDGTTTQTSLFSLDPSTGAVTVHTATTAGPLVTASSSSLVVPVTPALQTAFNGVNGTLSQVRDAANTAGVFLAASDLALFFDDQYMQGGFGKEIGTAEYATLLRGVALHLQSFTVDRIISYDDPGKVVRVIAAFSWTENGRTLYRVIDKGGGGIAFRKQADGTWRFFGNQQIADVRAQALTVNDMAGETSDDLSQFVRLQVISPSGSVTGAQVNHPSGTATLVKSAVTEDLLYPTWDTPLNVPKNIFGFLLPVPPIGTVHTFILTTDSGEFSYPDVLQATTTDWIRIVSPAGHTLADAMLGRPLTVEWTLPTSFPIGQVDLMGQVTAGGSICNAYGTLPGPYSGSGTITFPSRCNQLPVGEGATPAGPDPATLQVRIRGLNGEETWVQYHFR